jgi:hypothetical protein
VNNAWLISILGTGGAAGLFSLVWTVYTSIRDRNYRNAKQEGDVLLTEAQYREIAARAAQTKTAEQIQAGEYWMGQFAAISKELDAQRDWRKRAQRRWHEHKVWDDMMTRKLRELTGENVASAPSMDPDDFYRPDDAGA